MSAHEVIARLGPPAIRRRGSVPGANKSWESWRYRSGVCLVLEQFHQDRGYYVRVIRGTVLKDGPTVRARVGDHGKKWKSTVKILDEHAELHVYTAVTSGRVTDIFLGDSVVKPGWR